MGTLQTFKTTDLVRLEVETTAAAGTVNLIKNPSGGPAWPAPREGAWGWVTLIANTSMSALVAGSGPFPFLAYQSAPGPNSFTTEKFPVTVGQYIATRFYLGGGVANRYVRVSFEYLDAAGKFISSSAQSAYLITANPGTGNLYVVPSPTVVPAGITYARMRFDCYLNTSGGNVVSNEVFYVREVSAKVAATSVTVDFGYLPPWLYTDVIGPTHSIKVDRGELNVSVLSAEILDASIEPSASTLVRPGKRVQLMVKESTTSTWQPIFVGKIVRGQTRFDPRRTDAKRARISLSAVDAASDLAQITRAGGVDTIDRLKWVLEGCGVPWNIDGSGSQLGGTPTYVSTNPDASALDQVAITRDTALGYAWVSRKGILNVWSPGVGRGGPGTTPVGTLNESVYSDLDLDYDTDRCINTVTVKIRGTNPADGETVDVAYGPYVDQASIDLYRPHSAEFTVQGITDSEASAAAYAAIVLTQNATPAVRINSVAVPIRNAADVIASKALLDLYDMVTVANTAAGISQAMRATRIGHTIEDGKWMLEVGFTIGASVVPPTVPPPRGDAPAAGAPAVSEAWQTPVFNAGWALWADTVNEPPAYRKIGNDVEVVGLFRRTSGAGVVPWNMPAGYRPPKAAWGFAQQNGVAGVCVVAANGDLQIVSPTVVTGAYVSVRIRYSTTGP